MIAYTKYQNIRNWYHKANGNERKSKIRNNSEKQKKSWYQTWLQKLHQRNKYLCCIAVEVMKDNTSLWEYIRLFILSKGVEASVVCETDGRGGRRDRLLYWPITSLDHSMLCYLQDPLSTYSASRPGLLNRRPGMVHRPQRAHSQWL